MVGFVIVATACSGLFAGAALYITCVEHPARMAIGPTLAHTEFIPSYRRATLLQAPLALIGGGGGVAAWLSGTEGGWLAGGLGLLSIVPFTLVVIRPTNSALLSIEPGHERERVAILLARWGWLHAIRSVASVAVFLWFIGLLAGSR